MTYFSLRPPMMLVSSLPACRQRLGQRVEDGRAGAAADADDPAPVLDLGGLAERAGHVAQLAAGGHGHDVLGAAPDGLDDEGDGARLGIVVGDGQRDALAALTDSGR